MFGKISSRSFGQIRTFSFLSLLVFSLVGFAFADESKKISVPKVARVSLVEGSAELRRADSRYWERVVVNLPLIEGDSILTDDNSRLEIQFDKNSYLRLGKNSYLKILTLRNEGIVISLAQGNLSLRLFDFDKRKTFFEIDAPNTTIAVQKEGLYRVDASNNAEVKVKAIQGEVRVYSTDSGFTLRTGRSAIVQVKGENAGDWNFSFVLSDEWDEWVEKRDEKILERLNRANYARFYDDLLYGAEELEEYGRWIYTKEHGWVWKPYDSVVRIYSGWSPYRYGHWRWVSPFGWVWICDEPWGWVTYHYGRWVYVNGWVWIPHNPAWGIVVWSPALVVITYVNDYICWYPLPYHYSYSYTKIVINNVVTNNPASQSTPSPTPSPSPSPVSSPLPMPSPTPAPPLDDTPTIKRKPLRPELPPDAVVAVKKDEFGLGINTFQRATVDIAYKALQAEPVMQIRLPEVNIAESSWVISKSRGTISSETPTGVIPRRIGIPMEEMIRETKVFNGRTPAEENPTIVDGEQRKNPGAIKRTPPRHIIKREDLERWEKESNQPTEKTDEDEVKTPSIYVPSVEEPKESKEPRKLMPKPSQETPPPAKEERRPVPKPRYEIPPLTKEEPQKPMPKPKEEPKEEVIPPSKEQDQREKPGVRM